MGFVYIVLIFLYFLATWYGWDLRKKLKKTDYWKKLPSGTAAYGYCLPVLLFILLEEEFLGAVYIMLGKIKRLHRLGTLQGGWLSYGKKAGT